MRKGRRCDTRLDAKRFVRLMAKEYCVRRDSGLLLSLSFVWPWRYAFASQVKLLRQLDHAGSLSLCRTHPVVDLNALRTISSESWTCILHPVRTSRPVLHRRLAERGQIQLRRISISSQTSWRQHASCTGALQLQIAIGHIRVRVRETGLEQLRISTE